MSKLSEFIIAYSVLSLSLNSRTVDAGPIPRAPLTTSPNARTHRTPFSFLLFPFLSTFLELSPLLLLSFSPFSFSLNPRHLFPFLSALFTQVSRSHALTLSCSQALYTASQALPVALYRAPSRTPGSVPVSQAPLSSSLSLSLTPYTLSYTTQPPNYCREQM